MGNIEHWSIWRCRDCGLTDVHPGRLDERDFCDGEAGYDEIVVVSLDQLEGAVEDRDALATALSQAIALVAHAGYENNAATLRSTLNQHGGRS